RRPGGRPPPPSPRRRAPRVWAPAWQALRFRFAEKCNLSRVIRIAAAGDIHASEATRERIESAFATVEGEADVVLLAGDLTTTGEPEQAEVLAHAVRAISTPIFAVLSNHDLHNARGDEIRAALEKGGITVLERDFAVAEIAGMQIGIAEYRPDLVLHGHAHAGSFEGCVGTVPVYNVAVHVMGRDFWIFDLEGTHGHAEVEVEAPLPD